VSRQIDAQEKRRKPRAGTKKRIVNDVPEDQFDLRKKILLDPDWIYPNLLGMQPWSKQWEVIRSVRNNKRTAVRSCHGSGKTAVAAAIVLEYMLQGPCRVITTAPTWSQVEQLLWREIAQRHRHIDPAFGKLFKTQLEVAPDWFAIGLSTDTPERFQGHHAPRMLLVVDEASGVDDAIYEASEGFLTADGARVLLIGNPTRTTGTFYRAFKPDSGWHRVHISAFDSPNFTGEEVHENAARALVTPEWASDAAIQWGVDSPAYKIRVLGDFAETTGRQFFQFMQKLQYIEPKKKGRMLGQPVKGGTVRFYEDTSGPVKIYHAPVKDRRYIVFADVAGSVTEDTFQSRVTNYDSTDGSDYAAAVVIDAENGQICAEFHGRPALDEYAEELGRIAHTYNKALLAVERNSMGQAVLLMLTTTFNYPNLYRPKHVNSTRPDLDRKIGWNTNQSTRPRMLSALQAQIRDHPETICSERLIDELKTFVYDKRGREGADYGCHDDMVMAAGGAFAVMQETMYRPIDLRPPQRRKSSTTITKRAPRV
jgi:hypothetical protein